MNDKDESVNDSLPKTRNLRDIVEELQKHGIMLEKPSTKPLWASSRLGTRQVVRFELPDIHVSRLFTMEDQDCVRIGRYVPGAVEIPEIDLARYPVASQGISRQHALICREQRLLTVRDMNSTNGTYLNGQRLVPLQVRLLRNGDEVTLGYLKMYIYFGD